MKGKGEKCGDAPEPRKNFVKPVFEDFLPKRESRRKFVMFFDLGGRVPSPKPLGFEMGIHVDGDHLLDFLNCHIHDKIGGEMTVILPQREKKRNIKYDHMYGKTQKKMNKHR